MTDRETLIQKLSALQFAAWELHLYLDTHPDDCDAKELNEKYICKSKELAALYESKYGPLSPMTGSGEMWLKNPWPWDIKECAI